jgi:F-type H+-transporting ATPase subunit gamma
MRNLALLETRKLARAVPEQGRVVETVVAALRDVLPACSELIEPLDEAEPLLIVLGSERGFCGDFNRALLTELADRQSNDRTPFIAIGGRLAARLPESCTPLATLAGATTAEEVPGVLVGLMSTLRQLRGSGRSWRPLRPLVLHQNHAGGVAVTRLDPVGVQGAGHRPASLLPAMNLAPPLLLEKLIGHYLFAVLSQIFYGSLMTENMRRMRHMDTAVHRIDERMVTLRRKGNALRQEEIVEEIEVITMTTDLTAP